MSRTRHGSKGPGHEFWSRRPGSNRNGCNPGPFAKKVTHRAERRRAEEAIAEGIEDLRDEIEGTATGGEGEG